MPVRDAGIVVNGFTGLTRALRRIEGGTGNYGIGYEAQHRLRNIGEKVAAVAPRYVTHKYPSRPGPRLEDSVRVSVTQRSASVFSTSAYGGAQQSGAGPKAGWGRRGPHIQRANASKWMSRAVESQREVIAKETEAVIDWVVDEFNR